MSKLDNAKSLDEILIELENIVSLDTAQRLSGNGGGISPKDKHSQAKNAILHWIDREVIGNNKNLFFSNEVPTFNSLEEWMGRVVKIREVLRTEQRTILSQHGYKGGKR